MVVPVRTGYTNGGARVLRDSGHTSATLGCISAISSRAVPRVAQPAGRPPRVDEPEAGGERRPLTKLGRAVQVAAEEGARAARLRQPARLEEELLQLRLWPRW